MTKYLSILICALTCATLHAQSVIVKGTGAGAVHATGAGSVRGVAVGATFTNFCSDRFTVFNTNQDVVLDNESGLTWTRDANLLGWGTNQIAAVSYCSNLVYAGYDDWRLPPITELSRAEISGGSTNGLFYSWQSAPPPLPTNHPFVNIQTVYWTSYYSGGLYKYLETADGDVGNTSSESGLRYVWPCRGP